MGHGIALALANDIDEGLTNLDVALHIHFRSNHYPPLPTSLIPVAKLAITLANEGKWDDTVSLDGTGVSYRGTNVVRVYTCVEAWHLDTFLTPDDEF